MMAPTVTIGGKCRKAQRFTQRKYQVYLKKRRKIPLISGKNRKYKRSYGSYRGGSMICIRGGGIIGFFDKLVHKEIPAI